MKINLIKFVPFLCFLLSNNVIGQEINIEYKSSRNSGRILYSLSYNSSDGNDNFQTDPIFSKAIISDYNGCKYIIASISIDRYISKNDIDINNNIWLCMYDDCKIKFYYPIGTKRAYPFSKGISLFSIRNIDGGVGAVDLNGNIILPPIYDYITDNDLYYIGIQAIRQNTSLVAFSCNIFEKKSLEEIYRFQVLFDDELPRSFPIHEEFSELIDNKSFTEMITNETYDNDDRMYLWGIHKMLNLDFERALFYFRQIYKKSSFKNLKINMHQCNKLQTKIVSLRRTETTEQSFTERD